jgi:hypothetical protein
MKTITKTASGGPIYCAFPKLRGLKSGFSAALVLWSFVCGIVHADNGAGPDINVWRGATQRFGDLGVPQRCVNLLGTVSDPDGLASLKYTLNGGPSQSLSVGPDTRRLARPGDFNAELDATNLLTGNNSVVLTARDQLGYTSTTTVTLHYGNNFPWPLPYSIDWNTVTNPQNVVQEVDGAWTFSPSGARPLHMDYDRILAIGDMGWADYEITVPVTVHATDPSSFSSPISVGPGLGLVMRWRGHSDWGTQLGGPWQPVIGWRPQGANWWNEYFADGSGRLSLSGENGLKVLDPTYKQLGMNVTYMTRTRVQSPPSGNGGGIYRFKIWEHGTPEPISWLLEGQENAYDLSSGSLLLVAHHVDATFGNVTIVPPSQFVYGIKSSVLGGGSVTLSPDMPVYPNGTVVTATAQPMIGHSFSGWSGDLGGSDSSVTFVVDGDKTITATFNSLAGGGTSGSDEFNAPSLDTGIWTFVNPLGDGTLAMTGSQLSLSLPAGTEHDTWWPAGYNVARVTQSVVDEDFVVETKFDSNLTSRYQMQGIVIEDDGDSLLRVEFHHDGTATRLYVASFNNTVPTARISKNIAASTRYMRVTRTGDSWVIAHSSDGVSWINEAPFTHNMVVHAAGLYVGNHTAAQTALIDYFHISISTRPNQAPAFTADLIKGAGATVGEAYVGTLARSASDVDSDDTLTYTLASAPSWLAVAEDGTLSGMPANGNVGLNRFLVRVTDMAGLFDTTTLEIMVFNTSGTDEFNAQSLDTGIWTFINPLGDGTLAMTGTQLSLSLPAGTDHDTWWPAGYNVARITQNVIDEDFVIETKFDSDLTSRHQMQGVVIQDDGDSLIRVEFYHDGTATRLYVASFDNTVPLVRINKGITASTRHMRVTRTGDSWVIAHSSDGVGWITETPFTHNMVVHAVGLYVGNHTAAQTALIDYFHITISSRSNQAPVITADPIIGAGATEGVAYIGTLAGSVSDGDSGETLTYTLDSAPSWLAVAVDGTLSGTPTNGHVGLNPFMVRVTDAAGLFDTATLEITVNPAPVGDFRDWLTENALPADPTIDTDGDSIKNIIEYIIDGDPGNRNDLNLLPTAQLVLADPDGDLTNSDYVLFTYRRSDRALVDPTVSIKVEWSADLKTPWSIADDGAGGVVILPDDNAAAEGVDLVRVYIPRSLEVNGKLFARLRGVFIAPE